MSTIKYTEDFMPTKEKTYGSLQEAIDAYASVTDWGFAGWSRRVEVLDNEGKQVALKWMRSPVRNGWTLEQTVARIRLIGGDDAVDRYLDLQEPNVPWEQCTDCDAITPRNPDTLRCVYKESHE